MLCSTMGRFSFRIKPSFKLLYKIRASSEHKIQFRGNVYFRIEFKRHFSLKD